MAALQAPEETRDMDSEVEDELKAVLRTLKLAQAQMKILKSQVRKDSKKANEIDNLAVTLEVIVKKLRLLDP